MALKDKVNWRWFRNNITNLIFYAISKHPSITKCWRATSFWGVISNI